MKKREMDQNKQTKKQTISNDQLTAKVPKEMLEISVILVIME